MGWKHLAATLGTAAQGEGCVEDQGAVLLFGGNVRNERVKILAGHVNKNDLQENSDNFTLLDESQMGWLQPWPSSSFVLKLNTSTISRTWNKCMRQIFSHSFTCSHF